jgi:micrococcal nuclease
MRRRYYKTAVLVAAAVAALAYAGLKPRAKIESAPAANAVYYVKRVIDGDTIVLSNGQKVRLIGIDTPEAYYSNKLLRDAQRSRKDLASIQEMGKRASAFTRRLVLGEKVTLEYDVEKKDRYGRSLAYAYLDDGTFVNAKILEEGYAQVMTIPPNVKHSDYFRRLAKQAREKGKGLWAEEMGGEPENQPDGH